MKKVGLVVFTLICLSLQSFRTKEQYSYVAAEFQPVLNLTITSDPQVDFVFKSIEDMQKGIVRFNAVTLEVDATVPWDLYAYAGTDNWVQTTAYSANGEATLPAEILEIQSSTPNQCSPMGGNFNSFTSLKGLTNSGMASGFPDAASTQFVAGMMGTGANKSYNPGSAKSNPETNTFRMHYRIIPGIQSNFPNATLSIPGNGFVQTGGYYLEVVYVLVEDL